MRALALVVAASCLVAGCGGSDFAEREEQRSRENDENRRKAAEDLFGVKPEAKPENADADRGEGTR